MSEFESTYLRTRVGTTTYLSRYRNEKFQVGVQTR
jgi:hypothetical protein